MSNFLPKITVYYCEYGIAYSDFSLDKIVAMLANTKESTLFVSTENIIYALRVAHKENKIKLVINYENKVISVDKNGELSEYPGNFLKKTYQYLLQLI